MCLLEILNNARAQLHDDLRHLLTETPPPSADELVEELTAAYGDACHVFGAIHGDSRNIEVVHFHRKDSVQISAESGQLELVRTASGWVSSLLRLRGEALAAYLVAWPAFHVPNTPPGDLNAALTRLRHLLHEDDEANIERIAAVEAAHTSPLIHDYIQRHIKTWPDDRVWALQQHKRRRFAARGLELLTDQTRRGLTFCLELATDDPAVLVDELNHVLADACLAWSGVLGHDVDISAFRDGDRAVFVGSAAWDDGVWLTWQGERWAGGAGTASSTVLVEKLLGLLQTDFSGRQTIYDDPDYAEYGEYGGGYLTEEDELAIENAFLTNYCLHEHPEVLLESSEDDLLDSEEHWLVGQYFKGMQKGQDTDRRYVDYVNDDWFY